MVKRQPLDKWLRQVGAHRGFQALTELVGSAEGGPAAVLVVDCDRRVVHWSTAAEELLGFGADEVVGEHCLKASRCGQCMAGCGVEEKGEIDGIELQMIDALGQQVRVRKFARAFYDDQGGFLGGVEVLVPMGEGSAAVTSAPAVAPVGTTTTVRPPPPRSAADAAVDFHGLRSVDPEVHRVFEILRDVAQTDVPVLVRGDSGTGKELAARAVHLESDRRDGPFLAVNCGALSPTLLESELFGHVRGAFTGAVRARQGLFERAHGGTLFLDEVAELPLDLQPKLLRVLQEQTFVPVGGSRAVNVNVRIVAATHAALRQRVREGRFREDLMYRLRVVPVYLPALRERPGDLHLLLWLFLAEDAARGGRVVRTIQPDAMRALLDHAWPGNVRELQNVVRYASAVGRGPALRLSELPPEFREPQAGLGAPTQVPSAASERQRIQQALSATGGHVGRAAELLGVSRPTFWRMRKRNNM